MRHDKITAAGSVCHLQPCVFICTCCDRHEHRLTHQPPAEWSIETIDGAAYAFCADCSLDLPGTRGAAGAMATRIGVASQLDVAELSEVDEEDLRHARRLVGIAQAERVGRQVLPMLLGVIALLGSFSVVQHGLRWIAM